MNGRATSARRRRRVAIDAVMVMVILVLMVQMWLLTATLESYLAGHHSVALPGLLSSVALFAVCAFLYRLVLRIDRMPEREEGPRGAAPAPGASSLFRGALPLGLPGTLSRSPLRRLAPFAWRTR